MEAISYGRTASGAEVAFRVLGESAGEPLVYLPGYLYSIESVFEDPPYARFIQGLARHGTVVLLERQGIGASDPLDLDVDVWQQWAEDVVAVADAVSSDRVAVMGHGPSAHLALESALRYPERISKVIALHPFFQVSTKEHEQLRNEVLGNVARDKDHEKTALLLNMPSRASDQSYLEWNLRAGRLTSGPAAAAAFWTTVMETSELAASVNNVTCPVLFLLRRDNARFSHPEEMLRDATSFMRDRTIRMIAGADIAPNAGDVDALVFEVVDFLHGEASAVSASRPLAALLFTDIVESTSSVKAVGDVEWSRVLDQHDRLANRLLRRYGGVLISTTGDGAFMKFETPSRAVECAIALREELSDLGLATRMGIHLGEYEIRDNDVAGTAVHLAARVMALAGPGEIATTASVQLATLGGGVIFRSLGAKRLKGFDDAFEIFLIDGPAPRAEFPAHD